MGGRVTGLSDIRVPPHIAGGGEFLHPLPPEIVEPLAREGHSPLARHTGDEDRVRGEQAEPGIGLHVLVGKQSAPDTVLDRGTVGRRRNA